MTLPKSKFISNVRPGAWGGLCQSHSRRDVNLYACASNHRVGNIISLIILLNLEGAILYSHLYASNSKNVQ